VVEATGVDIVEFLVQIAATMVMVERSGRQKQGRNLRIGVASLYVRYVYILLSRAAISAVGLI